MSKVAHVTLIYEQTHIRHVLGMMDGLAK